MDENKLLNWCDFIKTDYSKTNETTIKESGLIQHTIIYEYTIEQINKSIILKVGVFLADVELYTENVHYIIKSYTFLKIKHKPNINELFEGIKFCLNRLKSHELGGGQSYIKTLLELAPYPELDIVSEDIIFLLNEFDNYLF